VNIDRRIAEAIIYAQTMSKRNSGFGAPSGSWAPEPSGGAVRAYDGDRKADLAVYRP